VEHAREPYEVSEQRACRVEWQWPPRRTDEDKVTHRLIMDLGGIRHFEAEYSVVSSGNRAALLTEGHRTHREWGVTFHSRGTKACPNSGRTQYSPNR
jgi:hypothetical protein